MNETTKIKTIGVIGAGAMGRGIVQLFAQSGYEIILFDTQASATQAALSAITATFKTLAEKGKITEENRLAHLSRIRLASELSELKPCQLVIEAIIERLDIKQQLFKNLESVTAQDCILASNTSSLSIAAIASVCAHPERVAGLHFFNPVPLMKVVEVIRGPRTETRIVEQLCALTESSGHRAVVAADMPGFIVNHAGRGYGTEALKLLGEGVSDIPNIDLILKEQVVLGSSGTGFKLGPFELMDLTGLDVSHPVMESIYQQFYQEPRYRPSALAAQRYAAGLFGRKSGEGFYRYPDKQQVFEGERIAWPAASLSSELQGLKVAISPASPPELASLITDLGAVVIDQPAAADLLIDGPLGLDLSQSLAAQGLLPYASKALALDTLFPYAFKACKRRVIMACPATDHRTQALGQALFASDGAQVSLLRDSPGFVSQRIIAMIVAVASEMAQLRIASPEDINEAVRLGLGYPLGPLAMGDALGVKKTLTLLENLFSATNDPRYRPPAWLKRRAILGLGLSHPE
jgi:3-hydroxybutyryl-CoA dehydrogenase